MGLDEANETGSSFGHNKQTANQIELQHAEEIYSI
jgi:hypothetical protein